MYRKWKRRKKSSSYTFCKTDIWLNRQAIYFAGKSKQSSSYTNQHAYIWANDRAWLPIGWKNLSEEPWDWSFRCFPFELQPSVCFSYVTWPYWPAFISLCHYHPPCCGIRENQEDVSQQFFFWLCFGNISRQLKREMMYSYKYNCIYSMKQEVKCILTVLRKNEVKKYSIETAQCHPPSIRREARFQKNRSWVGWQKTSVLIVLICQNFINYNWSLLNSSTAQNWKLEPIDKTGEQVLTLFFFIGAKVSKQQHYTIKENGRWCYEHIPKRWEDQTRSMSCDSKDEWNINYNRIEVVGIVEVDFLLSHGWGEMLNMNQSLSDDNVSDSNYPEKD